jgi:Mg2+ and Co2+ transporter CorA
MSQPPLPPLPPPPDAASPPASLATELKGTEQCSWLAQLINKTVYELRAKSLTQANERLDAEAMCHRAFTYELFAQMTREVLKKLDTSEQGSQQCAQQVQTMLQNLRRQLEAEQGSPDALAFEQQAVTLIKHAVVEASETLDQVMGKVEVLASSEEQGSPKRMKLLLGVQGEMQGVVVPALPALIRIVLWLGSAVSSGAVKGPGMGDMRSLLLALETSKDALSSMLEMQQVLIKGFTRQMIDIGMREEQALLQQDAVVDIERLKDSLKYSEEMLNMSTFMITDPSGKVIDWGEPARITVGIDKDNAMGGHLRDLCYKDSYPDIEEAIETVNAGGLSVVAKVKTFMRTLVRDKPAYVALTAVAQRDKAGKLLQISWIGEDLTEERAMHSDMHDEVVQINKEKEAVITEMHATKAENCTLITEMHATKAENCTLIAEMHATKAENCTLIAEMHATKAENCTLQQELFKARKEIGEMKALQSSMLSLLQGSK